MSATEPFTPEIRLEAIESLLLEKGLLDVERVERRLEHITTKLGPMNGARAVAKAWRDPDFRARLIADGTAAIGELGIEGPQVEKLVVVENSPGVHNVVVCTLCSCYPWAVLGLPPAWYKSPEYRARAVREPRQVLAEFGTVVADDVEVRVWDSSAEIRYMVLPEQPEGTDTLADDELAALVSRDSMIGVRRAELPGGTAQDG